jgi:hypothetical protein
MTAHRLFWQRAAAFGDQMAVLKPDRLLVQAGIADHGGGDLCLIGLDDAYAIFGEVLASEVERIAVDDRLDHRGVQKTQTFR